MALPQPPDAAERRRAAAFLMRRRRYDMPAAAGFRAMRGLMRCLSAKCYMLRCASQPRFDAAAASPPTLPRLYAQPADV